MLEANNVVKTFDGFRALDGANTVSYTHLALPTKRIV